ncbi:hypothetical protein GDO86_015695 [Hymenochirus boettgeri]|uniref:Uncharacterized protein n=1 Tax=Hymenochirus boettgeri TaxID=247094 RepID=A0A8T2JXJ3_9PIPI|nr:hypothetical protein GDO86_015695 [Hymenochirus boettgeri]
MIKYAYKSAYKKRENFGRPREQLKCSENPYINNGTTFYPWVGHCVKMEHCIKLLSKAPSPSRPIEMYQLTGR